ncbi:MAG TPA: AAA family ATPase, partial [Actinomycetota bacterium]|nr:AAA family ATPase [Actinomycetota bacterium]
MALVELTVRNLAVIESVRISLAPGFNVVTGETGAGKSLVIDALALALGGRASADQVRAGSASAHVEAIFDAPATTAAEGDDPLADLLDASDDVVIVRREVTAEGRSVIRLNDRAVTVGTLAGVGDRLAEIHGQHEQQRLLKPEHQMSLLDPFGGHLDLVAAVTEAYRAWRATQARMEELVTDAHELARRLELLEHQAGEIAAARLRVGEDAELETTLRAAQHGEAIVRAATGAVGALRGADDEPAAVVALRSAVASLRAAAAHDERFSEVQGRAEGLAAEAEELARDVEALVAAIDLDPASRERMEERLSLIYDMKRKYGDGTEAILQFGAQAESQLERLRNQDELRARARDDEAHARDALATASDALAEARRDAATRLADAVNAELPPLGLRGGAFGVDVRDLGEPGLRGTERIEFT